MRGVIKLINGSAFLNLKFFKFSYIIYIEEKKYRRRIMDRNNVRISVDISLVSILLVVFITLKLCKVISWSWLWVLSPLWIPIAFFLILALIAFIVAKVKGDL